MRMAPSLTVVSIIIICLAPLVLTISVKETIITSLVSPEDLTITSDQWIHLGLVMANVGLEKHPEQYYVHR